jgi:hypothetical protein
MFCTFLVHWLQSPVQFREHPSGRKLMRHPRLVAGALAAAMGALTATSVLANEAAARAEALARWQAEQNPPAASAKRSDGQAAAAAATRAAVAQTAGGQR